MAVAGITRQGLTGMAVCVGLLWGCLLGERRIMRQAITEQTRALRTIEDLRSHKEEPVSTPTPRIPRPARPVVG